MNFMYLPRHNCIYSKCCVRNMGGKWGEHSVSEAVSENRAALKHIIFKSKRGAATSKSLCFFKTQNPGRRGGELI